MAMSNSGLSPQQVQTFTDMFKGLCHDGESVISSSRLREVMESLGENVSDEDLLSMRKELDAGSISDIKLDQFLDLMRKRVKDEQLSAEDLRLIAEALGEQLSDTELAEMMSVGGADLRLSSLLKLLVGT
ncbi:unnamed protein product [Polarella glacialis]|nr:unnamed protein product [Polarella glacialis]